MRLTCGEKDVFKPKDHSSFSSPPKWSLDAPDDETVCPVEEPGDSDAVSETVELDYSSSCPHSLLEVCRSATSVCVVPERLADECGCLIWL